MYLRILYFLSWLLFVFVFLFGLLKLETDGLVVALCVTIILAVRFLYERFTGNADAPFDAENLLFEVSFAILIFLMCMAAAIEVYLYRF